MNKSIVVVGVGALGSHVVQFLRNVDVQIRIIDFDRVEQKNVMSQFHGKTHVGKSKVQALQQTMSFLFGQKIETNPHRLTTDNDVALLKGDLVIDCLDNGKSRRIIQNTVRKLHIPCLHGALAPNGAFGRVIWDSQFVIDDESGVEGATCEDGEHLPFIAIVSAYLARAAQEFIVNQKQIGFSISPGGTVRV